MSMNFTPTSVWGARDATMEEVNSFEEHWVELTAEDIERRERKVTRKDLKQGSYAIDDKKYAPKPQFAALYRADGSRHPVPLATYRRYLQKRDKFGNRVFFPNPPEEAPQLTSDPCPVRIGARICGKRMLDQYELILHIWRKHRDRAPYYLSQNQVKLAQGNIQFMEGMGIPDKPVTPPEDAPKDLGLVDLGDALREAASEKRVAEVEKAAANDMTRRTVDMTPINVVGPPKTFVKAMTKHSCEKRGRLGIYDPSCPRCIELTADKLTADTTMEEGEG